MTPQTNGQTHRQAKTNMLENFFQSWKHIIVNTCFIIPQFYSISVVLMGRITQTCPCNILQYFTAVKMIIFRLLLFFFFFFAQNIDCGYTLEPPQRGGSNEYPQSMFWSKKKEKYVYPSKPHFFYIKVGCKGVFITRTCYPDGNHTGMHVSMMNRKCLAFWI